MTIEIDIENALFEKAEAVASSLSLPLSVPNRVFNKPADNRWLRVQHLRNQNTGIAWGDETMFQGILQFDIFGDVDLGTIPVLTIAASIIDAFWGSNAVLWEGTTKLKIEQKPSVLSQVSDGQETFIPVSIRYRCFGS